MIAFEGVNAALQQAEIELSQPAVDAFVRRFVDGLEPKLATPRIAKIYSNALMFALPLLKGEANIVDLMLMEGIRILYPALYVAIRDNPDIFLSRDREDRLRGLERAPNRLDQLLESAMPGSGSQERDQVKDRLIGGLFPRTTNMGYGGEWDEIWGRDQKICAPGYFKRYFVYSVPDGDLADADVRTFIEEFSHGESANVRRLIEAFAERRSLANLIGVLRRRTGEFDAQTAIGIARAVAQSADLIPRERGPMVVGGTSLQANILISQLLRQIPAAAQRREEAELLMQQPSPLVFAVECLRWIRHSEDRPEDRRVLDQQGDEAVAAIVVGRIEAAHRVSPAYIEFPGQTQEIYWTWRRHTGNDAVGALMRERFDANPAELDLFLDRYVGEAWEMQTGLPVRSSFERRQYDDVNEFVGAQYIFDNLRQRYGEELDNPQRYGEQHWSTARRIAHQFADIHAHVIDDAAQQARQQAQSE